MIAIGGLLYSRFFAVRPLAAVEKWFILLDYRGEESVPKEESLREYDLAILDADHYPDFERLGPKTIRIAYVSVGEAEEYRAYWQEIQGADWILEENKEWSENHLVDVRSEEWHRVILDQVIPAIVERGFQGLFLDTLDTAVTLDKRFGGQHEGMIEAMCFLVRKIRETYPKLYLISNNGFEMLDQLAPLT